MIQHRLTDEQEQQANLLEANVLGIFRQVAECNVLAIAGEVGERKRFFIDHF